MPQESDNRDDFWTLDKIVPKRHFSKFSQTCHDTSCAYLEFGEDKPSDSTHIPTRAGSFPEAKKPSESYSYTPKNRLLQCVTIRPRSSPTRFYADFLSDAEKYADRTGCECKCVPFPSYVPEYRCMKKSQLDFYFYFRDCAKAGIKLEAPLSYILLWLFEIINIPHIIKPQIGAEYMCRAWLLYRSEYPKLDSYISDWLCDYCLIHRLDIPESARKYSKYLASLTVLPEFYLDPETTDRYTFLTRASGYTPDTDKYPAAYEPIKAHLVPALNAIASARGEDCFAPERSLPLTTGSKSSYRSALCAYSNNALISYTVRSFSKSAILREKLADLIKYCENKIRAYAGIRSRLKCPSVGELERSVLDDYFDKNLPTVRKKYIRPTPAYEQNPEFAHFYEPESIGISAEAARSIEERSWEAAFKLEEAFASTDTGDSSDLLKTKETTHEKYCGLSGAVSQYTSEVESSSVPGAYELEFLALVYEQKYAELKEFLNKNMLIADALAERINSIAFDTLGDSLLESDGENYAVIPDYTEEAKQWLNK